jgi:hypothetical protein
MIGDPTHHVIHAKDALETGEALNPCEVKGCPVVFVLREQSDAIGKIISDAGQGIESWDKVRMGREGAI